MFRGRPTPKDTPGQACKNEPVQLNFTENNTLMPSPGHGKYMMNQILHAIKHAATWLPTAERQCLLQ